MRPNGVVVCWGEDRYGQATAPDGSFVSVSAGGYHTCGSRSDGSVVCWGHGGYGQTTPPDERLASVSAGGRHGCGVRTDGSVVCWGGNDAGQADVPEGSFVSVSAGGSHTCGVKTDGTVACWGDNEHGQATPPRGAFASVDAGEAHSCGTRPDGSVTCWGRDTYAGGAEELEAEFRNASPQVSGSDVAAAVTGNTAFAVDLYQTLRHKDGNVFLSPYSISLALAMAYAGARGETERQIAETLHFTLPQERLHPALNALDLEIGSRGVSRGFKLNVANAVWGQDGYQFLPEYLDLLAENYGAGVRRVDFMAQANAARRTINEWVSDKTEGRVRDLLPPGAVGMLTKMVLTNAIYFKAKWAEPFDIDLTSDRPFHLLDGQKVDVAMMRKEKDGHYGYTRGDGYQAVEIPYDGWELSMVILLPDQGEFRRVEESLDAELLGRVTQDAAANRQTVVLSMPRFKFESKFLLGSALGAMGMPDAFREFRADFSGIDGTRTLFVDAVIHKAFVAVDEKGTEAAAATAVGIDALSNRPVHRRVTVDRPFIFLIRDNVTGSVLFIGRVLDPR